MNGSITSATDIGGGYYQEDRFVSIAFEGDGFRAWLLGVFDGHDSGPAHRGGAAVAEYCKAEIEGMSWPTELPDPEEFLRDLVACLVEGARSYHEGSTLSITLIVACEESGISVSVAVLGDSPVVILDRADRLHVGPEHNVRSNDAERVAVIARGGAVANGYVYPPACEYGLKMSRALGDRWLDDILSREPEIRTIADPVWVLVASDGLFDPNLFGVLPLEKLKAYAMKGADADTLMEWAGSYVLRDNVTAVVWRSGERM